MYKKEKCCLGGPADSRFETRRAGSAGLEIERKASAAHRHRSNLSRAQSRRIIRDRSWISEKCVALTTTTSSRSPPRCRPPLLKIGALRPQWPQMYPPNFQRLKLVPSTTRSRHPLPALYRVLGWGTHRAKLPPMILLPPMLTKPVYVAWPLARPHSRA